MYHMIAHDSSKFSFVVHTVHTIQTIRTHPHGPNTWDVCRLHKCTALYGSAWCTNCRSLPEAIAPSNAEANAGEKDDRARGTRGTREASMDRPGDVVHIRAGVCGCSSKNDTIQGYVKLIKMNQNGRFIPVSLRFKVLYILIHFCSLLLVYTDCRCIQCILWTRQEDWALEAPAAWDFSWPCRGSQWANARPYMRSYSRLANRRFRIHPTVHACNQWKSQVLAERPCWLHVTSCHYILLPLDALTMHCQLATEMPKTSRAFCSFTANDARVCRRVRVQLWRYMLPVWFARVCTILV